MNRRGVGLGALIGVILAVLLGFIFLKMGLQVIPSTPEGLKSFDALKDKLASPPGESFKVEMNLDNSMFLFFSDNADKLSYRSLGGNIRKIDRPDKCQGSCLCYCVSPIFEEKDNIVTCSEVPCKSQPYTFVDPASYGKDSLSNSGFVIQGSGQASVYLYRYTNTIMVLCQQENCVDDNLHHVLDFDLLLRNALKNCNSKDNPTCRNVFETLAKVVDREEFAIEVKQEQDASKLILKKGGSELWNFAAPNTLCAKGEDKPESPPFEIKYDTSISQPVLSNYGKLTGANFEDGKVCLYYGKT